MAGITKWTSDKEDYLLKNFSTKGLKELEAILEINQTNISIKAKKLGLSRRTFIEEFMKGEVFEFIVVEGIETGYAISNRGRIINSDNTNLEGNPLLLTRKLQKRNDSSKGGSGYHQVCLSFDGEDLSLYIHRLVACTFIHEDKDGRPLSLADKEDTKRYEVNHKDGNKAHNYDFNLEFVSHSYNVKHMHQLKKTALQG